MTESLSTPKKNSLHIERENLIYKEVMENPLLVPYRISTEDCCFYKIDKLIHDDEYPYREAFENVLAAMNNPEYNFVYMITGNSECVQLHVGICKNKNYRNQSVIGASGIGDILKHSFSGNFQGSSLVLLETDERKRLLDSMGKYRRVSLITGVPSVNERTSDLDFQGIDRLINGSFGSNWRLIIVCEPVLREEVLAVKQEVYDIYNELHKLSKATVQRGTNKTHGETSGSNTSASDTKSKGKSGGSSDGEKTGRAEHSYNKSGSKGWNSSESHAWSEGENKSASDTYGEQESVSNEFISKEKQEQLQYIDKVFINRLKLGVSKGLFKTTIYAMSDTRDDLFMLQSSFCSIFQGENADFNPLTPISLQRLEAKTLTGLVSNFQNDCLYVELEDAHQILFGRPLLTQNGGRTAVGTSTYLTAKEISIIAGIPRKEVPGLALDEGVEFGLNTLSRHGDELHIGSLINRGNRLHRVHVNLSKQVLNKHVFVAGVTGSGKTTTCQKLLIESGYPFLVIEPAKTEYRELYNSAVSDLWIFTLGNESNGPFRFNPFEILEGENITSHIDMLKATFVTAFPMEAAMPQILEESIYHCYQRYGWNFDDNSNKYTDDPYGCHGLYFPTLSDLIAVLKDVVADKKFAPDLKANYTASLTSRLGNLLIGSKGRMLNCRKSIDFLELLDHNVILELEDLKSPEDKAFIMGMVLARMAEALKIKHRKNTTFRHITLIEEAHRLLTKYEMGDSGAKKSAIEMFADLLAEVRKYGECLVVVDQIPNKLAADVLKNTNTKIIHKIFARDDKEAIGDTMMMNDKQKGFLSSLKVGEAIVFTEGWDKPVHIYVQAKTNTSSKHDDQRMKNIFEVMKGKFDHVLSNSFPKELISYQNCKVIGSYYEEFLAYMGNLKNTNRASLKNKDTEELRAEVYNIFAAKMEEHYKLMDIILTQVETKTKLSKASIWRQFVWRYIVEKGLLQANFGTWEVIFDRYIVLYETYLACGRFTEDEFLSIKCSLI